MAFFTAGMTGLNNNMVGQYTMDKKRKNRLKEIPGYIKTGAPKRQGSLGGAKAARRSPKGKGC